MPRKLDLVSASRAAFGGDVDALFARAFGRAAGAPSSDGNAVRLLLDARENYPAWLDAIRKATRVVLFESYIIADDEVGREFAHALADRARDGVHVYVVSDWLGSFRVGTLWQELRHAGARVAVFNPFQFATPLGWLTRDHRKMIAVDGEVAFVSGLCVSSRWLGNAAKRMEPWRDTGIEIRGPAVTDLEQAFDQVWQATGEGELPRALLTPARAMQQVGSTRVRVIAGQPGEGATYRLDLLIAALAHKRLWLTDAYFVGTAPYVQALRAAAADGVDVRLLVPGASDLPAVSMLSRAGYRALLEAGIRIFEWQGTMLHAKTAVADLHWSRIGSTNLNLASFLGNYELDVAVEDPAFAAHMAAQFEADLARSTEIVMTARNRVRRAEPAVERPERARRSRTGSAGRAAAGAVSMGSALGAALTNRRALGPAESGLLAKMAIVAIALGVTGAIWPMIVAWPAALLLVWVGVAWLGKAWTLKHSPEEHRDVADADDAGVVGERPALPAQMSGVAVPSEAMRSAEPGDGETTAATRRPAPPGPAAGSRH